MTGFTYSAAVGAIVLAAAPAVAAPLETLLSGYQYTNSGAIDVTLGESIPVAGSGGTIAGDPVTGPNGRATALASFTKLGAASRLDSMWLARASLPAADLADAGGIRQGFVAVAQSRDTWSLPAAYHFTSNFLAERAVGLTLDVNHFGGGDLHGETAAFVTAAIAAHGVPAAGSGSYATLDLGSNTATAWISVAIADTAPCLTGVCGTSFTRFLTAQQNLSAIIPRADPAAWDYFAATTTYESLVTGLLYPPTMYTSGWTYDANVDHFRNSYDRTVALDAKYKDGFGFDFLAGHTYTVDMAVGCETLMTGALYYLRDTSSVCDAAHSLYWNGITDARDGAGNPVKNVVIHSASGFDYRYASPLSPDPAAVAPVGGVPEPATWAMVVAGFALTGGALRRRSTRVVAA